MFACVNKNSSIGNNGAEWMRLYEELKSMIFESFLEEDLCGLGLSIVKEFLSVRQVHADVLKVSRGEVTRLLSNFMIIKIMCTAEFWDERRSERTF